MKRLALALFTLSCKMPPRVISDAVVPAFADVSPGSALNVTIRVEPTKANGSRWDVADEPDIALCIRSTGTTCYPNGNDPLRAKSEYQDFS